MLIFPLTAAVMAQEEHQQESYAYRDEALMRAHQLAEKEGFDEAYLQSLLLATKQDESVLRKISRPAEKTKTWAEYRPIFLDQSRIENGVAFWQAHADTLARAEEEYGVDPAIIVAILGVETRYGKVTGNTPVFAALSTLCFDYPERAEFFCEQWDGFLRMAQQQNFNPLAIEGSYAGAMGMAQFMPTSYLNDAVDYDGDGKIDLWHSADDAIGSIANYLANRGWVRGGEIAEQLDEDPQIDHFGQSHEPYFDRNILEDEQNLINMDLAETPVMVGSLILKGAQGDEWWLTYPNFYVITRYNTSPLYAMAVTQLSRQIQSSRKRHIHDEK
ncbi:lytic murein transglycosylase B [Cardiobacteriaceae bacterium TAE3-ERU3]|nr:lytic murein transglycosylase B [Cardiobacteriaceae bacterium TAE3-ERU3]